MPKRQHSSSGPGLDLDERHMTVDGESVSGSLFDFGLYFSTTPRS